MNPLTHSVSECTKGWHMVPVLNALDVRVAVFGNHEFGECIDIVP